MAWSSLAEGDEQLDRANSQTCMECCRVFAEHFYGFLKNPTAYHMGKCSLHFLQPKSSIPVGIIFKKTTPIQVSVVGVTSTHGPSPHPTAAGFQQ